MAPTFFFFHQRKNITKAAVIATGHIFGTDQRTVKHLQKFDTFAMTFLIIVIMIRDRLPNIHINIFKDITIQKNYKKLLSLIYEI